MTHDSSTSDKPRVRAPRCIPVDYSWVVYGKLWPQSRRRSRVTSYNNKKEAVAARDEFRLMYPQQDWIVRKQKGK